MSRQMVSRIERGQLRAISLGTIRRVVEALDASIDVTVRWQGEDLDRLLDSAHAEIVRSCVSQFADFGWSTRVEVSFNHFGDRGRVDVLAFHTPTRTLVVTEVKSAVGDEQDTLGRLDVKTRLGSVIAASVGWDPAVIVPALVIGDSRTARRIVADHEPTFARFTLRGRQALAWARRPMGIVPTGLLWFVKVPDSRGGGATRNARVRKAKSDG